MEEQSPEWKEVEPEVWKPEEEGDEIEGVLVNKAEDIGVNNSNLYYVETQQGIKMVWGSTVLDDRMKLVDVGSMVKIRFKGLVKNKKGQDTKIFSVATKKID